MKVFMIIFKCFKLDTLDDTEEDEGGDMSGFTENDTSFLQV